MTAVKGIFALTLLIALMRYVPVYYSEYNEFVRHEAARNHSESLHRQTLLRQAREYSLPVEPSDINFDETDNVLE